MKYQSETDKVRHLTAPYIKGKVIDIGFGGDKVVPEADGSDLPNGYANTGSATNDIPGDITQGLPVEDETYDTVYSSHLIEDFIDTEGIAAEHFRICKKGGHVVLVFPDQQVFVETCRKTGQPLNSHHKHANMGLDYMLRVLKNLDGEVIYTSNCEVDYNIIIVIKKK